MKVIGDQELCYCGSMLTECGSVEGCGAQGRDALGNHLNPGLLSVFFLNEGGRQVLENFNSRLPFSNGLRG